MMLLVASLGVGLVCFILYTLDRRSKGEPIDWAQASKLSVFGSLITSGVVFATTASEVAPEVAKVVSETVPVVQEMFVGQPTF